MNSEDRLREYVKMDGIYQDFKNGKGVFSDFDMFCVEHCKDIEDVLNRIDELEEQLYSTNQCVNEMLDVQEDRLLKIARKMHTWIFLHVEDEQKAYDDLGLSDDDNRLLGYLGQIKFRGEDINESED